jgi:hypothetical protein
VVADLEVYVKEKEGGDENNALETQILMIHIHAATHTHRSTGTDSDAATWS